MMYHKPNIRFIDSHTKSNGSNNNLDRILHPFHLYLSFIILTDVSMIECNFISTRFKLITHLLTILTRYAIYYAGLIFMLLEYFYYASYNVFAFLFYFVVQVWAIEWWLKIVTVLNSQSFDDILFYNLCDCGC